MEASVVQELNSSFRVHPLMVGKDDEGGGRATI